MPISWPLVYKNAAIEDEAKLNILIVDLVILMRNVSCMCNPTELVSHIQHFTAFSSLLEAKETRLECTKESGISTRSSQIMMPVGSTCYAEANPGIE